MNIKPIFQKKLYGLNKIFTEIINLSNLNKLPNKILISGPKTPGIIMLIQHVF